MTDSANQSRAPKSSFRRNFATGLLVLAPIWLTVYFILLAVRFLGGFLAPYFRWLSYTLFGTGGWGRVMATLADVTAFIVTVLLIALIGIAVRKVVGQKAVQIFNRYLRKVPVVRDVYESVSKFINVFFGEKQSFKSVVAVRFPTEDSWAIAFVTGERPWKVSGEHDFTTVFVPTAPNPTSGFMLLVDEEKMVPLSMTVDEAIKLIVSGGTVSPERLGNAVSAKEDTEHEAESI